jgi:hypothetical protein
MQSNIDQNRFNLPPPEELMKKAIVENEDFRTGA